MKRGLKRRDLAGSILALIRGEPFEKLGILRILYTGVELLGRLGNDGNTGQGSRKVGDESKSCDTKIGLSSIEFCDDIRPHLRLVNNDHGTKVTRLRLSAQSVFFASVANEDKSSRFEVEINDSAFVLLLEAFDGLLAILGDLLPHVFDVLGPLGELLGAESNQIGSRHAEVLGWGKVGRFGDIEGEKRMNTVGHIVWREARGFADSYSLSPEDLRKNGTPLLLVALACLHDGFPDIIMLRLDDSVGLGVVTSDTNVVDLVSFGK